MSVLGSPTAQGRRDSSHQRDRRNLTPDQLALVMGRHYNRTKQDRPGAPAKRPEKQDIDHGRANERLAAQYGVARSTVEAAGKFAAAVETLKVIDPEIEQKVVTGKGPTRKAVVAAAEAEPEEIGGDAAVYSEPTGGHL